MEIEKLFEPIVAVVTAIVGLISALIAYNKGKKKIIDDEVERFRKKMEYLFRRNKEE